MDQEERNKVRKNWLLGATMGMLSGAFYGGLAVFLIMKAAH